MIKHIKKSYSKDGNLTKGEEGIAYATAHKQKNKDKKEEYDKSKNCGCGKDPCITYGKQIDPDCQVEGKKIKKKEKAVQGSTDVPNFPQDQVSEHNDGSAKNCKKGEYFCKEDHKCKPIPKGHHVMPDGMLMKGEKHSVKEGAAWTKKSGKNKEGGLNEKGRKSYERDNPGSDLKAPSKKKGNKRRASFCARMKGMKKKLTSAKTARDPDSRINKSLRAWNCSYEPENGEVLSETMLATLKRKVGILGGKSNKKPAKKTTGRDAGAIARKVLQQKQHKKYVNFLDIDEEKKKCGEGEYYCNCLLYTSPSPRDATLSRMPSSA